MSDEQEEGNGLQFCQPRSTFHLLLSCCNRYAYVLNNPTTLTDPTGLQPGDDCGGDGWVSNAACQGPPPCEFWGPCLPAFTH